MYVNEFCPDYDKLENDPNPSSSFLIMLVRIAIHPVQSPIVLGTSAFQLRSDTKGVGAFLPSFPDHCKLPTTTTTYASHHVRRTGRRADWTTIMEALQHLGPLGRLFVSGRGRRGQYGRSRPWLCRNPSLLRFADGFARSAANDDIERESDVACASTSKSFSFTPSAGAGDASHCATHGR